MNGLQGLNDLRSFPTKLYQKFDVGSYLEILTLHGSKTTLNQLALDSFVSKRKMSGSNYSMAKNMPFLASMLKHVLYCWHSCHGRIPRIF